MAELNQTKNRIWILARKAWDYDEMTSCVVLAPDEATARKVAKASDSNRWTKTGGDWVDPDMSTATEVALDSKPVILLEHIRYG